MTGMCPATTMPPSTPTPFPIRSSTVNESARISLIGTSLNISILRLPRTAAARCAAPSPAMLLWRTSTRVNAPMTGTRYARRMPPSTPISLPCIPCRSSSETESSRIICTGMPRISPEPAQATAASSSSSGGSPSPSMQRRRAVLAGPPRNGLSSSSSSSSSSLSSRSTPRTAATLTSKPSQRSRARLGRRSSSRLGAAGAHDNAVAEVG